MDVKTVLHMNGGQGPTSYSQNSTFQKKASGVTKHIIVNAAVEAYEPKNRRLTIADLGCSSGPNTLTLAADIVNAVVRRCDEEGWAWPEFAVYLSDLPTNDFNTLFASLPEVERRLSARGGGGGGDGRPVVLIAGVPGSFYGRLFPCESMNFISSSHSLNWLSQVPTGVFDENNKPLNKGKMYISDTSPPSVTKAYFEQFRNDFSLFLESRSKEMVRGGTMVLTMSARRTVDHRDTIMNLFWDVLSESFAVLLAQGVVEEEKLDSYNIPIYTPNIEEIEDEVQREGSFKIDHIEIYEVNTSSGDAEKDARIITASMRAVQESMISHHFGEEIIETLFQNYVVLLREVIAKKGIKTIYLTTVLKKAP